jgi:PEP-CTERM motif
MRVNWALCLCAIPLLASVGTASATIVSVSGAVSIIAAPANARVNEVLESNSVAEIFAEQTGLLLGSGVTVDFTGTGFQNMSTPSPLPVIPAGTRVSSYLLVTDPLGADPFSGHDFKGSITFDSAILAVILLDPEFANSNAALGNVGTLYSSFGMGLELFDNQDTFVVSPDGKTLSFAFSSSSGADHLRIVTAAGVPEPSTVLLLAAGLTSVLIRNRKRA